MICDNKWFTLEFLVRNNNPIRLHFSLFGLKRNNETAIHTRSLWYIHCNKKRSKIYWSYSKTNVRLRQNTPTGVLWPSMDSWWSAPLLFMLGKIPDYSKNLKRSVTGNCSKFAGFLTVHTCKKTSIIILWQGDIMNNWQLFGVFFVIV